MNISRKFFSFLLLGIFILASCQKTPQTPEPILPTNSPEISDPLPTITDEPQSSIPTKGPTPTTDFVSEDSTETSIPEENENYSLELVNELELEEYSKLKWCADQSCVIAIAYDRFFIYSYPELDELFSKTFIENEFLLDVSPDGKSYAVTSDNELLLIKNLDTQTEKTISPGTYFMGGEFSPDGNFFMITSGDQWAGLIFDVVSGDLQTSLTGFQTAAPIYNVSFSKANDFAIWIARATIQVSQISSNQLYPAIFHHDFIMDYDMNPAGTLLATSASEVINDEFLPAVFFYDFVNGELIDKFNTEKPIYSMQFSPLGENLTFSLGNTIKIYNIETKELTDLITFSGDDFAQFTYSPNENLIAISKDGLNFKFFNLN